MRFLVDECTGPMVARWLRAQSHDVFSVFEQARGLQDDDVLAKAHSENRILITDDKDFGEKVFRERAPHRGVNLLRLGDGSPANKITVLESIIALYADRLQDRFVVASEHQVRFASTN